MDADRDEQYIVLQVLRHIARDDDDYSQKFQILAFARCAICTQFPLNDFCGGSPYT